MIVVLLLMVLAGLLYGRHKRRSMAREGAAAPSVSRPGKRGGW